MCHVNLLLEARSISAGYSRVLKVLKVLRVLKVLGGSKNL